MYMVWTGLGCLVLFVNSLVWKDNVTDWAPVWCDIGTFPPSCFCLLKRTLTQRLASSLAGELEFLHRPFASFVGFTTLQSCSLCPKIAKR